MNAELWILKSISVALCDLVMCVFSGIKRKGRFTYVFKIYLYKAAFIEHPSGVISNDMSSVHHQVVEKKKRKSQI